MWRNTSLITFFNGILPKAVVEVLLGFLLTTVGVLGIAGEFIPIRSTAQIASRY